MTPEERAANLSAEWTGEGENFSVELYGLAVDAIRAAEAAARADGWRAGAEAMREAVIKRLDEALPELAGWTELTALPIPEMPPSRDGAP